jgi:hypothetical protein
MVYINMVFSLGHLVIFGGKPENCEIPESFRDMVTSAGLGFKKRFVLKKSLNN